MSEENSQRVLGLENNVIRLHEHSWLWAELFREEKTRITAAVGGLIIDLQHIGSTAIPGIKAKPILDMLAGVTKLENSIPYKARLESIGYDHIADAGIADDHVFGKGHPRTHYLHVVEYGGPKWTDHLCFRDRLRSDPALAKAYESLKEELTCKFSDRHAKYHEAKLKFINKVVTS